MASFLFYKTLLDAMRSFGLGASLLYYNSFSQLWAMTPIAVICCSWSKGQKVRKYQMYICVQKDEVTLYIVFFISMSR